MYKVIYSKDFISGSRMGMLYPAIESFETLEEVDYFIDSKAERVFQAVDGSKFKITKVKVNYEEECRIEG